jgi:tetratricopeptide (TPR) repeat protein
MKRLGDISLLAGVLLPLVVLLALGIYPRPFAAEQGLDRARKLSAENRGVDGKEPLHRAAVNLPWRADLWEETAQAAFSEGDFALAIQAYRQAVASGQISNDGWIALGDAYQMSGDLVSALATWEQILEQTGPLAEVYERMERAHRAAGDLEKLANNLTAHLRLQPQDAKLLFLLAQVASVQDPEQAIKWSAQAETVDPAYSSRAKRLQAGLLLAARENDPSYRSLVIGRSLASLDAWAFLGEARQHLQQDGSPALSRALEIDPHSLLAQALQAVYWQRQGKPDRALPYLHAIAGREPENPVWQVELGNALTSLGNQTAALAYYQNAIQLAPENPVFWKTLASFSIQNNFEIRETGLAAARQAVLLDPQDPDGLDLLGLVYFGLEDDTSAERFFLRALDIDPNHAGAHLHIGSLYLQEGKQEAAYQHLRLASNLQPEQVAGQQAQRLLNRYFP